MATIDFFLKIDGIEGESSDAKHKGEIELESWTWGESQTGSHSVGSGGGAGKVAMQDFNAVMKINKASPKLMLACATGEHLKSAVLTCRKAGKEQQEYFKVTLTDLLVSSYQTGAAGHGGVVPTDTFSLNYSKIQFEYREQKADGSLAAPVKAGYCLKSNTKL
jgi:type VI secretion system secreted protein Hcp